MRWLIIILLFASCNPVKKVLQNKERTEQVVREYVRQNPPKNDTIYIPGEVILRDTSFIDSIAIPFPVNHTIREVRVIEKKVTDTLKVIDRTLLDAVNNRLTALERKYAELEADRNYWREQARVRLYALIGLIVLFIIIVVVVIINVFKPKVRL